MSKVCSKCNCTKSLDSFGIRKAKPDGHQDWCKPCLKEYNGNYYLANKEQIIENVSKWCSDNREKSRTIKDKWRNENPDKQLAAIKRWQKEHEDQFLATKKKWRQENSEVLRVYCINRRRKLATGSLSKNIVEILMEKQNGICPCCTKPLTGDYHIDHIMPVAKGGTNTDDNVQLLHGRCNMIKNDRYPWELPYPLNTSD